MDAKYDRVRRSPAPETLPYLHLSDLRAELAARLRGAQGIWLDFGAGTSPYSDLFGDEVELRRADLGSGFDYTIVPGQPCPAPDGEFDGVLSTQVLQHVPDAHEYLLDAHRLLHPGGELVLTASSAWEEHAHPIDSGRWTRPGLTAELDAAGFVVDKCVGVTGGARAVAQIVVHELGRTPAPRPTPSLAGALFTALRLLVRRRPAAVNRWADRALDGAPSDFYLAVLAVAHKP